MIAKGLLLFLVVEDFRRLFEIEKLRLGIVEQDHRRATVLILRSYLDPIRVFRWSCLSSEHGYTPSS